MKKILSIALLFITVVVQAQIPQPKPNTYINDFAGVIPDDSEVVLNQRVHSIEANSSVQIAIILVDKLPDNMEIEDFAREIGRQWKVGNAKNGIVYVASISEHKQRLEVAQNLEGDIPDIVASDILSDIKPYFKSLDYYGGINQMLEDVNDRINPVIKEQQKLAMAELEKQQQESLEAFKSIMYDLLSIVILFCALFGVVYILWLKDYWKKKRDIKKAKESIPPDNNSYLDTGGLNLSYRVREDNYGRPILVIDASRFDNSSTSSSYNSDTDSPKTSSSDDSSSYGDWGDGSSDSSSTDSGFTGGGSSDSW
jgi:uncharacterized protein